MIAVAGQAEEPKKVKQQDFLGGNFEPDRVAIAFPRTGRFRENRGVLLEISPLFFSSAATFPALFASFPVLWG